MSRFRNEIEAMWKINITHPADVLHKLISDNTESSTNTFFSNPSANMSLISHRMIKTLTLIITAKKNSYQFMPDLNPVFEPINNITITLTKDHPFIEILNEFFSHYPEYFPLIKNTSSLKPFIELDHSWRETQIKPRKDKINMLIKNTEVPTPSDGELSIETPAKHHSAQNFITHLEGQLPNGFLPPLKNTSDLEKKDESTDLCRLTTFMKNHSLPVMKNLISPIKPSKKPYLPC